MTRSWSAPGDVNWNEPDCRRDYADAARADVEELAFMRLARSSRRAIEPQGTPRCLSVTRPVGVGKKCPAVKSRSISILPLQAKRNDVRSGMFHLNYGGLQLHDWR